MPQPLSHKPLTKRYRDIPTQRCRDECPDLVHHADRRGAACFAADEALRSVREQDKAMGFA
jgi:hypothetical protein